MKSQNKNDSLRDVQMFKHLFDTCEKNNYIPEKKMLIKSNPKIYCLKKQME